MAEAGIDKLVLTTQDYNHKNKLGWSFQPPAIKHTEQGEQEQGLGKWFINEDTFNATISEKGLLISLNPSKPYHPYHLCSEQEKLQERTQNALNRVREAGLDFSINELKVSRIDISRNELMKQPFADYIPAMSLLSMAREKRQATYPSGRMIGNNQRGLIIYDKTTEVRERKEEIEVPENLARAELQIKTTKAVQNGLEFYKLSQVNVGTCQDYFRDFMQKQIFKAQGIEPMQLAIPFDKKITMLKNNKPAYIEKMFGAVGVVTFWGSIDLFCEALRFEGHNRMFISRKKKFLHKALADHSRLVGSNNLANNYTELKRKFCA